MATVVEKVASGTSTIAQGAQAKEAASSMYTDYQVAVIKGTAVCGIPIPSL
jgi:hypothetical protein